MDPDLRDPIGCRRAAGPRRAATHHAAPRTGDHVARRGRPRTGLRAVEWNARHSAPAGGARCLVIPLSAEVEPRPCVLSLQYHFPGAGTGHAFAGHLFAGAGTRKFEFPSLGDDTWVRRAYWQLLLPPEDHVIASPRELTGEFAWGWNHFYFGRQPVLSQADLERWVGLSNPGSTPAPTGMNVYLFSSLGRIGPAEVFTAGRSTIVFVASGVALLAGLLLIYLRAARHPVVLLAATAILAGLSAIHPEQQYVA